MSKILKLVKKREKTSLIIKPTLLKSFNEKCLKEKLGRFYCPELKWYLMKPCPFESREECTNYNNSVLGKA